MKILFAWELGASSEILWCMRRTALALKKLDSCCKIAIACSQALDRKQVPWADKVYWAPRVAFQHDRKSSGTAQQLHELGWTTDELRGMHLTSWSSIFEQLRPDITLSFEAPSATLVGTMLGNRILMATARRMNDAAQIEVDFPELAEWFRAFSGHRVTEILNRPGISYLPTIIDVNHSSLVINATMFDQKPSGRSPLALLVGIPEQDNTLIQRRVTRGGIECLSIERPQDLFSEAYAAVSPNLVIGCYDPISTSFALNHGLPYLGRPGVDDSSIPIGKSMEQGKRAYRLDSEGLMIDLLLSDLRGFQDRALEQFRGDRGGACSPEEALDMFLRTKKKPPPRGLHLNQGS